jgi:RHS repeat-associated protein
MKKKGASIMTKRTIKSCSVKTLAIFLSVLMIFYLIPATAYASLFEATGAESVVSETSEHTGEIFEDVSRREENVKHFRLEDGTYMAAQYDTAVHTLDENGEWQDIDNTLSESGSEYSTSNARIKFAKKITGNESIFTLHENNRKITLSLDGAIKKTTGVATNTETEFDETATTLQKMMTLDKLSSHIIYEDILDGVDLEYIVNGNNIKENIIVKEKKDSYVYSFTLKLNNLTAVMRADGSIIICDNSSGAAVYTMPAPVMWDAMGNISHAVDMTLSDLGNGSYKITVTAASEWMNESGREFPIVIDPAISSDSGDMQLNQINSSTPSTIWSAGSVIQVSNTITPYIKFNFLPTVPEYAHIIHAKVSLKPVSNTAPYNAYVGAYNVLSNWDHNTTYNDTISYLSEGQVSTELVDYNYINSNSISGVTCYWDVTKLAREWYTTNTNYGIALKYVQDTGSSGTVSFSINGITNYPSLTVTYKDMFGLEDYWSFASHSAGLAGDGAINLATGNLVFNINTLTTTDALIPFTFSLTYNSAFASKAYNKNNRSVPFINSITPLGFMSNLNQSIIPVYGETVNGVYGTYYIYTDADGTEHAFLPSPNSNEPNIYYDEDGLQLKLTITSDTYQTIQDANENTYIFTNTSGTNGNNLSGGTSLTSIKSIDGYQLYIDYNTLGQPSSISIDPDVSTSSKVTQLNIYYDSNGHVKYILNAKSQQAVLFYYTSSGDYLNRIVYAHQENSTLLSNWNTFYTSQSLSTIKTDATCYYVYDSNNRLLEVRDALNQREIHYQYDASGRVNRITEYGQSNNTIVAGQCVGIEYFEGYTKVRTSGKDDRYGTSDDIITVYTFDNAGRCITNYSSDITGYELHGATAGEYVEDNTKASNNIKSSLAIGFIPTNYLMNGDFSKVYLGEPEYWDCSYNVYSIIGEDDLIAPTYNKSSTDFGYNVEMIATSTSPTTVSQTVSLSPGTYTLYASLLSLESGDFTVTLKAIDAYGNEYSKNIPVRVNASTLYIEEQSEGGLTFEVTGNTMQAYTVSLEIKLNNSSSSSCSIYLQYINLSKSKGGALYNKVTYGSFEQSGYDGNYPIALTDIWSDGMSSYSITNECYSNNSYDTALKLTSSSVKYEAYRSQTIYEASQTEIDEFKTAPYSIPSKSYQVAARGFSEDALNSPNSSFGIYVTIDYIGATMHNGSWSYYYSDRTFYIPFCPDADFIQYILGHVETEKDLFVQKIEIKCDFSHQDKNAVAYFDDISFCYVGTNTSLTETEYNEDGYVTETHSGYDHTWYIYSGKYITTQITNNGVTKYTYYTTYGQRHRVKSSTQYSFSANPKEENGGFTSTAGLTQKSTTEYQYNGLGLVTETKTTAGNNVLVTRTQYITDETSHIVGLCSSETNELGQTTFHLYDDSTGYILAVLYPDDTGLSYTYDKLGRLEFVYPATFTTESVDIGDYYNEIVSFDKITDQEKVEYLYDNNTGRLKNIKTVTTQYNFIYDAYGNTSSIKVGSNNNYTLAQYEYKANNGKLQKLTYGNGDYVEYIYDELDRIIEICYNGSSSPTYRYAYDSNGNLSEFYDYASNQVTSYIYDRNSILRTYYVHPLNDSSKPSSVDYSYDSQGRTTHGFYTRYCKVGTIYNDLNYETFIRYTDLNMVSEAETILGGQYFRVSYSYNPFGSVSSEYHDMYLFDGSTASGYRLNYQYKPGSGSSTTSMQVGSVTTIYNNSNTAPTSTTSYTYDSVGNITSITIDGILKYSYEYDDLGQLTRENNAVSQRTYVYTYDKAGNIDKKQTYGYTTSSTISTPLYSTNDYKYEISAWKDLLTSFGGTTITYDGAGNPTSGYFGHSTVDLEWASGRRLSRISADEEFDISFTYNDSGIRTSKNVDGTVHYYTLEDNMILSEEWTVRTTQYLIIYHYDAYGSPIGMSYRTSAYGEGQYDHFLYVKNLQGDITGIIDEDGTLLVTYAYDAWGYHVSSVFTNGGGSTAARYNPFRYRGYYYDTETGLYYVNSRYYNPVSGRFISADGQMSGTSGELLGNNLFAYCFNNPVNFSDNEGNWPSWATKLIIGTAVIAAAAVLTVATAGTGTALACFAAGALKGAIVGAATGALSGAATGAVSHLITEGTFDGIGEAMLEGAADGYMMGAITGFISGGLTSNQCFVAGTAILTSIGYVSIQNIEAGDWVWASDLETGETELKQVVQTFVNEATELVHLTVNGEEIISTMEHPFYSPVKGWTAACKLRAGDILVMLNGEYVVVEQVQHELLETPIAVYNFEVDGFHTYYVGSTSILVHNLCVTDKIDDTYNQLKATHKGSGKEIHHIVEKRFADTLNVKKGDMLSIALDKADHRVFTKLWRDALPYGKKYTVDQIWQAAQDVYKNYPILLDAAKRTIFG